MAKNALEYAAIVVLILYAVIALIGPLLIRENPNQINLSSTFRPPNGHHLFGTDELGRDILAQVVDGTRISLGISLSAILIACVVGTILGMTAGFFGGWLDMVISRLIDAQLSLPSIILALVLVTVIGPGFLAVVVLIASAAWVSFARIIRAEVLVLRESEFVALARVAALPRWRILYRHLLPNVMPSILVLMSLQLGTAIIAEASLSFLGLGVQPPEWSWGLVISDGRSYLQTAPWIVLVPSVAIVILTLSANLLGDYLRDRIDPSRNIIE